MLVACVLCLAGCEPPPPKTAAPESHPPASGELSPVALAASPNGQVLYLACATARQVLVLDARQQRIRQRLNVPGEPSGLALAADGRRLFVTCAGPDGQVCVLDPASGKLLRTLTAGHTPLSPVLSRDGKTLFVCNRFNDALSVFDLRQARETARIPVAREPVSAALTPDGRFLLVHRETLRLCRRDSQSLTVPGVWVAGKVW